MEKLYFFSDSLLSSWEDDLELAEQKWEPSQQVLDSIIDYALSSSISIFSPTLGRYINVSVN